MKPKQIIGTILGLTIAGYGGESFINEVVEQVG